MINSTYVGEWKMYCVIQEVELKKPDKYGHPKELISGFMQMSFQGQDCSYYWHHYSEDRFVRPVMKAYKISLHQSYRENGKVKKKQYPLCTVSYYNIADGWFCLNDIDKIITSIAGRLSISSDVIYDLIQVKLDPLIVSIQNEYRQTEEYKTHEEHERITTIYAANKTKFNKQYGYEVNSHKYDEIYDVFGNLMNKDKLAEVEADFIYRQEYEEKSRSYQKDFYSNYSKFFSGSGGGSYSENMQSNHSTEDKETLKQFYRVLSKRYHPDANPDTDTSKQMQLLNQLKQQWGI